MDMQEHRRVAAAVLLGLLWAPNSAALAAPETYPLAKVRRGQTGYGLTTIAGTQPERFAFEVVSVVRNFLPKQDIILVKSSDPKLAVTGFWQGMSGSPLFIEDKVACAFSYGFRFNKVALGGCTPIEYMKRDGLDSFRRASTVPAKTGGYSIVQPAAATMADWRRLAPTVDVQSAMDALGPARRSWLLSAPLPAPLAKSVDTNGEIMTASVPLSVSGFTAPAFGALEALFGQSNAVPVRSGGAGDAPTELGPTGFTMGGAIAVQLIRGDMSATAIGTVSYVDGNNVLAFGHPLFQAGESYAPVATANVHAVIPSSQTAFALASPIREIGSLVQDRQSAIAADTKLRTPVIPMDIKIASRSGKHVNNGTFHVELLNNKFLTPAIAGAALMNAINYYLPDRDDVTARVESSVTIKGYEPIRFVDYVYANDGAASVMGGVRGLRVIVPLLLNPYSPVTIKRVDIQVDLAFEANYGEIKEVRVPTGDLIPGTRNLVNVVLTSWDSKEIVEAVPVDVPTSLSGTIVQLEVAAGDSAKLDAAPPVDLASLIAAFRKLLPGTVWAATLYPADEGVALEGNLVRDLPSTAIDKLHPQSRTQRVGVYKPIARTLAPTTRVINGTSSLLVRVRAK
jgi:hypothetical protein